MDGGPMDARERATEAAQAPAVQAAREPAAQVPAGEQPAEEAAPAFWRAQGLTGPVAPAPADGDAPATAHDAVAQEPATEAEEPVMVEDKELAGADTAESGISAQRWSEILVAFVDDPRGSVMMAADAVDEAIDEFVNSVRARQGALSSSWQDTGTGTEQLRVALRGYRTLWHQVRHLDLGQKTGG